MPIEFTHIISACSLLIAAFALFRNIKGDTKQDAGQLSEILVKMEIMQSDVKEIKADFKAEVKGLKTDVDRLKDRITIVEQSTKSAHKRIDELHNEHQSEE